MRSQTPSTCQRFSRRWAVASSPSAGGRSAQAQPVRKTYKIASRVRRSSARGRPVRAGGGRSGQSLAHWASVSSALMSGA